MATFKDCDGREWVVALSIDAVKRVRARCAGVDLLAKNLPATLEIVLGDYVVLGDVLFTIVEPQAKAAGVSPESFGQALAGDAIEAATLAFLDALRAFTPNPRDRARVGQLVTTLLQAAESMRDRAEQVLARESEKLLTSLRSGSAYTNSPESSASIPATSPSEN